MSRNDIKRTEKVQPAPSHQEVLADLARARVAFQLRALEAIVTAGKGR